MAPYMAVDNQAAGYNPELHHIKSCGADSLLQQLGLSKSSHTLGKPTSTVTGSPGTVRGRETGLVLEHHHQQQHQQHHAGENHISTTTSSAPTIRVIHIFAPKIIKTDVANFRSTVQRLTGRPRTSAKGDHTTTAGTAPGSTQRRARTKTVAAAAATTSSPDSSSGFQDIINPDSQSHELFSRQSIATSPPRGADSMSHESRVVVLAGASTTAAAMDQAGCNTLMEIDNCSPTSINSMDDSSASFSFYNMTSCMDVSSHCATAACNHDDSPCAAAAAHDAGNYLQQGSSSTMPVSSSSAAAAAHGSVEYSSTGSFFSYRQTPYALNEIPAPFFSGDILHSCTEFTPMISCSSNSSSSSTTSQEMSYTYQAQQSMLSSRDPGYYYNSIPASLQLPSFIPPLHDYNNNGLFSDLDILPGLQGSASSTSLPDLPPLAAAVSGSSSSNGLFYNDTTFFMQPPLCR